MPRSVVVVGASEDPSKRGNQVIRALQDSGYPHPIYGVNPRGGSAYDVKFLTTLDEVPLGTDLALVAVAGSRVPDTVRGLGARDVAGAVVLANGFSETGEGAAELQAQLEQAIRDSGVRVIGPNTSGVLNVPLGLNLVGLPDVPAGPVTVLTQSGNMLLSLVEDDRTTRGPGIASYIGLGNQVDLAYHECLEHFARDESTGAIAVHCEGLSDGRSFLEAAARSSRTRPIVMLRGGRSDVGKQTALSHTGSIAGSDAVAKAVLPQAGIELVDRGDELAVISGVLATTSPMADGTGVAVLADGGGHATLAADSLSARGVPLAGLSDETRQALRNVLGTTAALHNPVDVAGATDADPTIFGDAVDILMRDPAVGLVMIIGLYGGYQLRFHASLEAAEDATAARLVALSREHKRSLLVQSCYAGRPLRNHDILRQAGIQVLSSIDHSVRAAAALARRGRWLATVEERSGLSLAHSSISGPDVRSSRVLPEPQARQLVEDAGLSLGEWAFARSPEELDVFLGRVQTPCAVKVVSQQVVHKSDVGGVALNVAHGEGRAAWSRIARSVREHRPDAMIDGMVVTPMAASGVELLVGATRDPIFGPIVAFGSGGALVEAMKDVSFRAAPFTRLEARELIAETMAGDLLDGFRGLPPVDRDSLEDLLVSVGAFIADRPEIVELDLNPIIASGQRLQPVDVRIVVAEASKEMS